LTPLHRLATAAGTDAGYRSEQEIANLARALPETEFKPVSLALNLRRLEAMQVATEAEWPKTGQLHGVAKPLPPRRLEGLKGGVQRL
jgi:hypothetical protein